MSLNGSIDPGFEDGVRLGICGAGCIDGGSDFNSSLRPAGAALAAMGEFTPAVRKALPLSF